MTLQPHLKGASQHPVVSCKHPGCQNVVFVSEKHTCHFSLQRSAEPTLLCGTSTCVYTVVT
eukprot:3489316-Amphidinium_carterae.2